MDWLNLETPMVGVERKIVTFWRSRSMENAFPRQFHDNKCLWDSLVLYYFGYEVILFQIFFKYQNPENKLSYVTKPEFRINPEIFHPWKIEHMQIKVWCFQYFIFRDSSHEDPIWWVTEIFLLFHKFF